MRIDRISLDNVVRFERFEADFSPHFNVIIGENGAGKSSILRLISRALAHWTTAKHKQIVANEETRESIVTSGGAAIRVQHFPRELRIDGVGADRQDWQVLDQNLGGNAKGIQFSGATARLGRDSRAQRLLRGAEKDLSAPLPIAALFTPWREEPHTKKVPLKPPDPARRLDGYAKAFDLHADFQSFAAWFKGLEMQRIEDGETSAVLEAARASVICCLPECSDVRWVPKINDVLVTLGGETHPAWRLSDGYRTMLALVGELAWRAAVLNPGLGADVARSVEGVVLIDELDLHLHPRWQRRVVGDLRRAFPRVQFIATTHSPFVIQSMQADEVINLDREPSLDFQVSSVEDIAEVEMGVEGVQRSRVFHDKVDVARKYLEALKERPVERGVDPNGYAEYGQAYGPLVRHIGRYCSYCEAPLKNGHIEHVLPKDEYPHLPPRASQTLSLSEQALARELLVHTGVDRDPTHANWSAKDDRWDLRNEVWDKAIECRGDLAAEDTPTHRKRIADLAAARGFWSVWRAVFATDADMLQRIDAQFPGTDPSSLDPTTRALLPRPGGRL